MSRYDDDWSEELRTVLGLLADALNGRRAAEDQARLMQSQVDKAQQDYQDEYQRAQTYLMEIDNFKMHVRELELCIKELQDD